MSFEVAGVLAMGTFYALVFAVGLWASRRTGGDEKAEDLLLAGRGVPVTVGVFTMTATWVGGGYINGTAEAVYDTTRGLVWAQAPWGYAISLVLGGLFFARTMRRHGFTTLLDPFERRYGKGVAAGLFLPALVGEVFWSAAILAALGTTFGTILGYDFETSILLSAVIAIAYTVSGGLWAVAYTDVLQLLCILLGLGIAVPFLLEHAGGAAALVDHYTQKFQGAASLWPSAAAWAGGDGWGDAAWNWLDYAFLLVLGGIPWGVYFQRVLSSRDEDTAVRLSLAAGAGCIVLAIPAVLIGAVGATVDWAAAGVAPPETPALALPWVLRYLTPPLVAAIGLGAVAAAVMSSVDSSILSAASMFVWNVYCPLFRPGADDREIRWATRASILGVGLAATWLALTTQSVYDLWYLCSDLVYVILFPQLVMALFNASANAPGAVTGALLGLFLRLGGGEPLFGLAPFLPYPMQDPSGAVMFPFRTFAMVSSLLAIGAVSRMTAHRSPPRPLESEE